MTEDPRQHSRSGAASGLGARSGAGHLQGDAEQPQSAAGDRQPFAGTGAFTGRPIEPQAVPEGTPTPAADEPTEATIDAELHTVLQENAELTGHLQRLAADFDNFRKRSRRDIEAASANAADRLIVDMLVVLDDLERALEHAGDESASQLAEGIRMVHGRMLGVLTAQGLQQIECDGPFDPHQHEAMMLQPTPGMPDGTIVQVLQKGWRIGERVVRHAKVIVAGSN